MRNIKFAISSLVDRINDRIQLDPAQIFRSVDCIWLVLLDDMLLCPETRKQYRLKARESDFHEEPYLERLVDGARELSAGADRPIGLLLPLSRFLYSRYAIQLGEEYLGNKDMIHSAIALQKDLLLPAFDQEFVLAAAVGGAEGVAFWFPESVLAKVEAGFLKADLKLVAVMPRTLAIAPDVESAQAYVVSDVDESSYSLIKIEDRVATRTLSAFHQEFDNQDIKGAWDEQTAPLLAESPIRMSTADDWLRLKGVEPRLTDYLFFTRQFQEQVNSHNRQRRVVAGGALTFATVLILSVPFVYQWADAQRLERARDIYREEARMAAEYQNEILDMEYEWGVVYEYPEANVGAILTSLNTVIDNSLTSFSFGDSNIEIQGYTQDPEQLTRLLLDLPIFEDIEQSRTISESNSGRGDRFGFRMTLSEHDYEEYSRKYDFR